MPGVIEQSQLLAMESVPAVSGRVEKDDTHRQEDQDGEIARDAEPPVSGRRPSFPFHAGVSVLSCRQRLA
jgi:hypothetical protein